MEENWEKRLLADDVYCVICLWDVYGTSYRNESSYVCTRGKKSEFMSCIKIFWYMPRSQPAQWLILVLFFPFDGNPSGGEGYQ